MLVVDHSVDRCSACEATNVLVVSIRTGKYTSIRLCAKCVQDLLEIVRDPLDLKSGRGPIRVMIQ